MPWKLPSLRGFIARILRRVYNIELHIARERDKLVTHLKTMGKVSSCFKHLVKNKHCHSIKKTNILAQDVSSVPSISIGDCTLVAVEDFTYLGSTISSSLSLDSELNSRIGKASAAMARLSKRVWENPILLNHQDKDTSVSSLCVEYTVVWE